MLIFNLFLNSYLVIIITIIIEDHRWLTISRLIKIFEWNGKSYALNNAEIKNINEIIGEKKGQEKTILKIICNDYTKKFLERHVKEEK